MFLTVKPLTIKSWSRGGDSCPMGSSLPNHDAKDLEMIDKRNQRKNTKKTQGQTASDKVRAKNKKRKEKKRTNQIYA